MARSTRVRFWESVSIGAGMALATSCFGVMSDMGARLGAASVLAVLASAAFVAVIAGAIGRMARRFPSALGIRTYTKAAFGNLVSLSLVFAYLLMMILVAGLESNLYGRLIERIFPSVDALAVVVAVFVLVSAINALGLDFSRRAQLVMVAAMLSCLLALSITALSHAEPAAMVVSLRGIDWAAPPVAQAVIGGFFLFAGFEWSTTSLGPGASASVHRILSASIAVLAIAYVLFLLAITSGLTADELKTGLPHLALAQKTWGAPGAMAMLLLSTLAVLTTFSAGVMGASRLLYYLAREGAAPRWLARTVPSTGAPIAGIGVVAMLGLLAAAAVHGRRDLAQVANLAAVLACTCYCGYLASSLRLDWRDRSRATGGATARHAVEACALAAMCALLLAIAHDDWSQRGSLGISCALGAAVLLGALAHLRGRDKAASAGAATARIQSKA